MRAGVPVVASRAGSLPEVLGDGALMVDPGDHDALVDALDAVVADEALRARLVAAGTAWSAGFSWNGAAPASRSSTATRRAAMAEATTPSVLLAVEQLRRQVPGGIGAYARGLIAGLTERSREGDQVDVTLLASRAPAAGPTTAGGVRQADHRLAAAGTVADAAWDHGWRRAPSGFDIVHSVSLAAPTLRQSARSHLVVTVHDVAWHRHPEATTRRGRRWHELALTRARDGGAALVVPSRLVAVDVAAFGVDPGRITVVRGGADHLPDPDPGRRRSCSAASGCAASSCSRWARSSRARTWTVSCAPSIR